MRKITPYELDNELKRLNSLVKTGKSEAERNAIFSQINRDLFQTYLIQKQAGKQNDEILEYLVLIEFNLNLVLPIMKQYKKYIKDASEEDIFSVARIALIKAINGYDFNQPAAFATYAHSAIFREFYLNFIRLEEKEKRQGKQAEPQSLERFLVEKGSIVDIVEYEYPDEDSITPFETIESNDKLISILKNFIYLRPNEQYFVASNLGLIGDRCKTKVEIGIELGITREAARSVVKNGLEKLYLLITPNSELTDKNITKKKRVLQSNYQFIEPIANILFKNKQEKTEVELEPTLKKEL